MSIEYVPVVSDVVDPFGPDAAPRRYPLTYPGAWPEASVIITSDALWELRDRDGAPLRWEQTPPVRLGACRVRANPTVQGGSAPQLNRVTEERHATMIDGRVPVISVGSNAAPAQLRHKFSEQPERLLIPSVQARVTGMTVAYTPFVASFGYIPATAHLDAGCVSPLAVQFLDLHQLQVIDVSESPHYKRVWLDESVGVDIILSTGERLAGAYAYVSVTGVLTDARGEVLRMQLPKAAADERALSQSALQEALRDELLPGPRSEHSTRTTVDDAALRELLGGGDRVRIDPVLAALPDEIGRAPRIYGRLLPTVPIPGRDGDGGEWQRAIVDGTPNGIDRRGRSVVRLPPTLADALGNPGHVVIRSAALSAMHGDAAPAALAAVHASAADEPAPPPDPQVQVDHVLRMACGVERGDTAEIAPAWVARSRWFDWMLGTPTYLTMRVTLADTASTERDVVLMNRLAIDVLGISAGDYVVLEGMPDTDGIIRTVVVKAFEAPGEVEENRRRVTGGVWGARFPAADETLGVTPDLPMAFIDAELRSRLGIYGQTLATVRVRPGRLHQFFVELREILLVLAVAFLGIVVAVPAAWLQTLFIVALFGLSVALVVGRMRRRFSHRSASPRVRSRARK